MAKHESAGAWTERHWQCLHCRAALDAHQDGLHCPACGKHYPIVCGIPVLVSEPVDFLRSELALLTESARNAAGRREQLDKFGEGAGLTSAARERHRDVLSAE